MITDEIERISGYPPANFLVSSRRTILSLIHPDDVDMVLETVAMLLLVEAQVMPRPLRTLPFASFVIAASCRVDLACTAALAGETVTDATGIGEDATVVPSTTFESSPKMAPAFRVPRNATSSKLYFVTGLSPATVQVNADPIAFPESGVVHVPDVVELAEPHESGETA
jgi:hypothetical protein